MGNKKIKGITFVEVMVAALLLVVILLPVFNFLTKAVHDTEKIYAECVAITKAKQIMDTMLFQIPWQDIRVDSSDSSKCYFEVPELKLTPDDKFYDWNKTKYDAEVDFLKTIVPMIFCDDRNSTFCQQSGKLRGDGLIKTEKGIWIRTRAKVVDLEEDFELNVDDKSFKIKELTSKDADGNYNLVKKIIVQVKWTLLKERDPELDPNARSIFLVGFKSNL